MVSWTQATNNEQLCLPKTQMSRKEFPKSLKTASTWGISSDLDLTTTKVSYCKQKGKNPAVAVKKNKCIIYCAMFHHIDNHLKVTSQSLECMQIKECLNVDHQLNHNNQIKS